MAKKLFHWGSRTTRLILEGIAVLFGLLALGVVLLGWRLATGPVDIGFASDYIEQALYDPTSGYQVEIGGVSLAWPDLRGPLSLEIKSVTLTENRRTVLTVSGVSLGLSGSALLAGRIAPVALTLHQPALRLIRDIENNISLSIESEAHDERVSENSILEDLIASLGPERDPNSPLSLLQSVEVINARAVMEDHALGISWFLKDLDFLFIQEEEGLLTTVSLDLPGGRDKAANIQAEAIYIFDRGSTWVDLHIQDFDPRIIARKVPSLNFLMAQELYLNGEINLHFDSEMALQEIGISALARDGSLSLDTLYTTPLPYDEIMLEARYNRAENTAEIANLTFSQDDLTLHLSGNGLLDSNAAEPDLFLKIPNLPQSDIKNFWPDKVEQTALRTWLVDNLGDGTLTDIAMNAKIVAFRLPDTGWESEIKTLTASFGIEDMSVDYRSPLTPARNVRGFGTYSYGTDMLEIGIEEARVGDLSVSGGSVTISKVTGDGVGEAKIDLDINGPLPAVFDYIALEPIGMTGAELGLDTANIKGRATLNIDVAFPTLEDLPSEQVDVDVSGTLHNLLLPDVVKSLDLSGKALSIAVGDGIAALEGNGLLEGRPVAFSWQQYIDSQGKPFSSKIKASLNADKALRDELGIDLSDWIEGTVPVDVTYTEFGGGRAEALVLANLKPAILKVEPFDYRKPGGAEGTAKATALFSNGLVEEIKGLDVKTTALNLKNGQLFFKKAKGESTLHRGDFPQVTLKESDFTLRFEQQDSGALDIAVKGAFLDARPFLNRTKKEKENSTSTPPLIVTLHTDRMRTEDTQHIFDTKLFMKRNSQGMLDHLEMDARAGKGDIYFRLKPDETGKMVLRFEADDAGATLRAFGIHEDVVGGQLVIHAAAKSPSSNRALHGNLQLTNFSVRDAPVLAQLISVISPTGLPQLLSGEGLIFARLDSAFTWHMRPEGDLYVMRDGRTSGSSLGLTFEGVIDKGKNEVDVSGHVVPMTEINQLIGQIPVIGQILSGGGKDAIFAATYSITGPTEELRVFVNPLAALTPGIIRKILFEDRH